VVVTTFEAGIGAWRRTAATLALGVAGGGVAMAADAPAPWLVGSALAVGAAAVLRLRVDMTDPLRDLAFAMIGISMGSNVSSETPALLARWPASLAALLASLVVTLAASSGYLVRFRGWDRETALLSATPGALGLALGLAAQGHGDIRAISLSQAIRLMMLTAGMPILVGASGLGGVAVARQAMAFPALAALLVAAFVAGAALRRLRVPAPLLLGGMATSAAAQVLGLASGGIPVAAAVPAFVITGSFVGARFRGVTWPELRGGLRSGLVMVAIAGAISAVFAVAVAWGLRIPFGQAWVAFAPGGVETMAAMAMALGFDPAYVGAHHVLRIVLLSAFVPFALARATRATQATRRCEESEPEPLRRTGTDGRA
jgi:membrane AbrB-like protein